MQKIGEILELEDWNGSGTRPGGLVNIAWGLSRMSVFEVKTWKSIVQISLRIFRDLSDENFRLITAAVASARQGD